jgi:beta-propeller repeat-containing protein/List-Bact-rpt repeat protein/prealbumin domain-containing protein
MQLGFLGYCALNLGRISIFLLLISILLLVPLLSIQHASATTPPTIQYTKTWGGSADDYGQGVAVDASGNIYVTGYTLSFGPGNPSQAAVLLLKYNSSGILQWQRIWSGTGNGSDVGVGVAVDSSSLGGPYIYVSGYTGSFGAGLDDVLLLKFDSSGSLLWQKTWGGSGGDQSNGVAVDSSGNVYVTGDTSSFGTAGDVFLLKFDSSGSLTWQKTWGGSNFDYGVGVAVDSSSLGGPYIYVSGATNSFGAGGVHMFLLKFDSSGSLKWQKIWGGSNSDYGSGVAVDSSGNIYVTGTTYSFGAGGADVLLLKFDPTSALLWQETWGGGSFDGGAGVAVDSSGNVYVTGSTFSFGPGSPSHSAIFVLKLSSAGSLLNQEIWGGSSGGVGHDVAVNSAGDAFITGFAPEAPPYSSTISGNSTLGIPNFALQNPSFTLGTPTFSAGTPSGTVATPFGSQTYAGGQDVFLTLYAPTTYRLTLQTSTGTGSISVNSTTYANGQSVNLTAGSYTLKATPPAGFTFTSWSSSGGLTLTSTTSNPTTASITGISTLNATFTPIPKAPLPTSLITLTGLLLSIPIILARRRHPKASI